ncbi:MAG: DUF2064 domain-containing protein [Saprospiraceae bacterium]
MQAHHNQIISSQLYEYSKKLVRSAGLPFFILTEKQQVGNTFGEKFSNAIAEQFEKGFQEVIAIGADCPFLTPRDLQQAVLGLKAGKAVIGPSKDGGIYLLGISKKQFEKTALAGLNWETEFVLDQIKTLFEAQSSPILELRTLVDLDSFSTLHSILHLSFHPFIKFVKGLRYFFFSCQVTLPFISRFRAYQVGLRAPPYSF